MKNIVVIGVSCLEGMAGTRRVRNLIDPLLEKQSIYVSNLIYEKDSMQYAVKTGIDKGVQFKIIGFSKNIFSLFKFYYNGCKFLSETKRKSLKNILYNYDSPDIKNISFILYAKLIGYKIIFDIVEDHRYAPKHNSILYTFRVWSSVFLLKALPFFSDWIVVISEHLRSRLHEVTKKKTPITFIPITVNLRFFNTIEKKNYPENWKIFYGGSFGEKDGLEFLIKAFDVICSKFKNITLVITGTGNSVQLSKFNQLISETTCQKNIIYKGYVSVHDYYKIINDCDIFCMTRNNSSFANAGFPFKLGEFLAVGKAVIATAVGDIPLYLKNNINAMLIRPESTSDLVDALSMIITNPGIMNRIGKEARKTAEVYFDTEVRSLQLLDIFEAI